MCEHCFHCTDDDLMSRIVGPARTMFLHTCCLCGERVYHAYELDESGTVSMGDFEGGHLWEAGTNGERCSKCSRCSESTS